MTTDSSAKPRTIDVDGIKTRYFDAGEGEAVLLLHGSGPGVSAWANWRLTIPLLSRRYRVLALDIVGFGSTERPSGIRYGVRAWVDHVVGFMDALGVEQVNLVGNSMGGRVSLGIAHESPERVRRMVLMGTGGVGGAPTEALRTLREYQPSLENMRRLIEDCFVVDRSLATEALVRERYQASIEAGVQETYWAMFHSDDHDGSRMAVDLADMPSIATPTLLVHGYDDRVIPVANSWKLMELLPNADLVVMKRCGHWAQLEHPDKFAHLVLGFFS